MYDERQPKRRNRTLINNEQIDELEKALVDEPEMHKTLFYFRVGQRS
ncbi:Nodulin homeobox [Zea mays]|uniref:Nodulin homeobox n=1 Tax=Zea mays TaxID=4577 RepID=A0A1D6F7W4_MAIZE|nr:Nodulin homeobox [Zea mays]